MRRLIEIYCENNKTRKKYEIGTSLGEMVKDMNIQVKYPILGAKVNNRVEELSYQIVNPKNIRFIDISDVDGMRMYIRSISFVLIKAVKELYPGVDLKIEHAISKGLYCELGNLGHELDMQTVLNIVERMKEIVAEDIPFIREEILTEDALKIFQANNFTEKVKLFKSRKNLYTSVYYLGNMVDYFYGYLVPSTGYLKTFDLIKYYEGMLLMLPNRSNPDELEEMIRQDKMFDIFQEHNSWGEVLGVATIGSINQEVLRGNAGELIKISEALHEKKVSQIADVIKQRNKVRVVLISGPSSSGKTTFCKRLAIQLKVAGLKPFQISLDNYFVDREKTPKDENGEYNFEALEALDIEQFNQDLVDLMDGKEVKLPQFSFEHGKRFYTNDTLKISSDTILLLEGIHALNPDLTPKIHAEAKFKIYVSALTQVGIDGHNRIPTTDNRLIRRIIRDHQYRKYSALATLRRWPSVRKGEEEYIFPFQEEADIMFNSALLYELGVIKKYIEPVLKEVHENEPEYSEARRLSKFLSYFVPIQDAEVPPTSILREFLSGSSFKY